MQIVFLLLLSLYHPSDLDAKNKDPLKRNEATSSFRTSGAQALFIITLHFYTLTIL
jgi:hypothetical protein